VRMTVSPKVLERMDSVGVPQVVGVEL
jgi:hypothetical protein